MHLLHTTDISEPIPTLGKHSQKNLSLDMQMKPETCSLWILPSGAWNLPSNHPKTISVLDRTTLLADMLTICESVLSFMFILTSSKLNTFSTIKSPHLTAPMMSALECIPSASTQFLPHNFSPSFGIWNYNSSAATKLITIILLYSSIQVSMTIWHFTSIYF